MRNLLLALLSSILLSTGWLGISGIPLLVGFIPLLIISTGYEKGRSGFWKTFGYTAFVLGLWSGATTWWIGCAPGAEIGAVLSVLITVFLFGAVFMLFHYVSKRAPKVLAYTLLVAGWIVCEYLYTVGEVSFPWLVLGNGFAGDVKLVQWYSATGVFGGSLWVLVSNVVIFEALRTRRGLGWIAPVAIVVIPAAVSLATYYTYKESGRKIVATVVQPNFNPYTEKFRMDPDKQVGIMLDLAAQAPANVDYIIFPETALNNDMDEATLDINPTLGRFRALLAGRYPSAAAIIGASTEYYYGRGEKISKTAREYGPYYMDFYNSALLVDTTRRVGVHHKSQLVIGVEKMPYAGRIEWLDDLVLDMGGTTGNLGVDNNRVVFKREDGVTVAAPICWEAVFGQYISEFVTNGAQALFIISNDGWWKETQGYRQLFKYSRLRAIENRRSVARSANTGRSGFINQRGEILSQTDWDERVAVTGEIALNDKITFYAKYGDYVARISCYVLLLCVLYYLAVRFRLRLLK